MNETAYTARRAELIEQFLLCKQKRLWLSAKARVRAIAKLDQEQHGISPKETYRNFYYDQLGRKEDKS